MVEQFHEPDRDMDQRVPVAPAGLDQHHANPRVLGQAVGEDAAGRAGADNNVIRLHDFPLPKRLTHSSSPPGKRGSRATFQTPGPWIPAFAGTTTGRYAASFCRASSTIIAAPFSAIMIVGALVFVAVA